MKQEELNQNFNMVIKQAQELKIPVPDNIYRNVLINSRPKKRFGCCRKKNGKFQIEISEFVLECDSKDIRGILAHELLHTCNGCYNHGNIWKVYAERFNSAYGYNIKRTSLPEELGIETPKQQSEGDRAKYIIKCRKCGREYTRQRRTSIIRNINAYRCGCGGKLTVLKQNGNKK